jgi:hypothetical protein
MENLTNTTNWNNGPAAKVNPLARSIRICLTALPLLASVPHAQAGGYTTITPQDILREKQTLEAGIRSEANAPGLPRADETRIMWVMAKREAKEQAELAEYAKFQFDQKLELAQASAPRITIYNGAGMGGAEGGTTMESSNGMMMGGHHGKYAGLADKYADKDYVRQIVEQSTQQMSNDAAERVDQNTAAAAASNGGMPYGAPVPGKPGMITSPASPDAGYIDARGYAPGSQIIDPYSGQAMRVP